MSVNTAARKEFMSGFGKKSFIEVKNEDNIAKSSLNKTGFAFKLQKSPPKIKTALQGSVTKAFVNPEELKPDSKNKLFLPTFKSESNKVTIQIKEDEDIKFFYLEPSWCGKPDGDYKMDVLKSGTIVNTLNLSYKNYHVIGKAISCDISLTNETISQFHAILLYRKAADSENEKGMYIYDLDSMHGTYVNGNRVKCNTYVFLHSGYIISFGDSQTRYILQTPKDNEEKEAELSFAELQELKRLEAQEQKRLERECLLRDEEEKLRKDEELSGIDWGIVDNDKNSILTNSSESLEIDNEELFLDDPQKALKDWFEWEGHDLEYFLVDEGFGYYSCSIDLILDAVGTKKTVKVYVYGDGTKAVHECSIKACQKLNKYGLLKRAREEKKSITKNWEAVDYYDSDEDNFLDRTGIIEKKRQQRMQVAGKLEFQTETHNTLLDKHSKIVEKIKDLERLISLQTTEPNLKEDSNEDPLDAFMANLETSVLNKNEIRNCKIELQNLRQEEMALLNKIHMSKLANKNSI